MTQTAPVSVQAAPVASLRVREAEPADWPEVVRVSEAAFAAGPYGHLPVREKRQRFVRDVEGRAAAGAVLVAERAGEIVGTLSIARAGTGPSRLAVADEAEVRLLAVSPTAQRLGVARRLMLAASETALGWGASALVLDTGGKNFAAQALYEGLSYQRTSEPSESDEAEGRIPHVDYRLQLQPDPAAIVRLVRPQEIDAVAELSLRAYELEYNISGNYRDDIVSVGERGGPSGLGGSGCAERRTARIRRYAEAGGAPHRTPRERRRARLPAACRRSRCPWARRWRNPHDARHRARAPSRAAASGHEQRAADAVGAHRLRG